LQTSVNEIDEELKIKTQFSAVSLTVFWIQYF